MPRHVNLVDRTSRAEFARAISEAWSSDRSKKTKSGHRQRHHNRNLLVSIAHSQVYGKGFKSFQDLPDSIHKRTNNEYFNIPSTVSALCALADEVEASPRTRIISDIFRLLKDEVVSSLSDTPGSDRNLSYAEAFFLLDGTAAIMRLVQIAIPPECEIPPKKISDMRNECLSILVQLCVTGGVTVTSYISSQPGFVNYLFKLMNDNKVYDLAVQLAEEILAWRETTVNLAEIPGIVDLIRTRNSYQLALFCRILALVVYEPEEKQGDEPKPASEILLQRKRLFSHIKNIDRNHAVLISTPDFLDRMVKLLIFINQSAGFNPQTSHVPTETMLVILMSHQEPQDDWHEADSALQGQPSLPAEARYLRTITLQMHQVEVIFVICTLLNGKRKAEVQDKLAALGLVQTLETMFDRMEWDKPPSTPEIDEDHQPLHGPGCECNPESALRTQFLRLVHNFCDRDSDNRTNKHLLLSEAERAELESKDISKFHTSGQPGLLTKIIKVLLLEKPDSTYHFWLASCVESFLRGADYLDQVFVAKTGLLEYLIREIASDGFKVAGNLQTNFDLLGELVKFNWTVYSMLESMLTDDSCERLFDIIVTHLVDSNVFIRSVILSTERFRMNSIDTDSLIFSQVGFYGQHLPYRDNPLLGGSLPTEKVASSKIFRFIQMNSDRLLRDLMSVVSLEDINQENICCLNTALLFFVFAQPQGATAKYLQGIRDFENESGKSGVVTKNYYNLLDFWKQYYTQRGRDCWSLEYSSLISFKLWRHTVETLTGPATSVNSLLYKPNEDDVVEQRLCPATAGMNLSPPRVV